MLFLLFIQLLVLQCVASAEFGVSFLFVLVQTDAYLARPSVSLHISLSAILHWLLLIYESRLAPTDTLSA